MVVQHLHTVQGVSSNLTVTTIIRGEPRAAVGPCKTHDYKGSIPWSSTNYLSKVLSGCIRGLGPCGQGSNPCRETSFCPCILSGRGPVL